MHVSSETSWLDRFRQIRHSVLLVALIVVLLLQPVAGRFVQLIGYIAILAIIGIVFERGWQRRVAALGGSIILVCNAGNYWLPEPLRTWSNEGYHFGTLSFLAFTVATILGQLFHARRIGFDHVIGAFTGLILAGMCWSNLYLLIEIVSPGCFRVRPELADQLQDEQLRRFLFNHLSFATLSSGGSADISAVAPVVRTLTWLETLFGQFYFAVFIGQLVGLRLSSNETAVRASARPTSDG